MVGDEPAAFLRGLYAQRLLASLSALLLIPVLLLFFVQPRITFWPSGEIELKIAMLIFFGFPMILFCMLIIAYGPVQGMLSLVSDAVTSTTPPGLTETMTFSVFSLPRARIRNLFHSWVMTTEWWRRKLLLGPVPRVLRGVLTAPGPLFPLD